MMRRVDLIIIGWRHSCAPGVFNTSIGGWTENTLLVLDGRLMTVAAAAACSRFRGASIHRILCMLIYMSYILHQSPCPSP